MLFDPDVVSYDALLDVFWQIHNPTARDRQGADIGEQYRSVVFYISDAQKQKAEASKERLNASGVYVQPVVTEIVPASVFYEAEAYHQKYHQKTRWGDVRGIVGVWKRHTTISGSGFHKKRTR